VSWQKTACIAPTTKEAMSDLVAYFQRRGLDLTSMSEDEQAVWLGNFIWGDPDSVGEQLAAQLQPGIDGFTINMPANGHVEGRVELLGQTLAPLIR
jgi:alkanesulfonate monooxygenase SsuD/methylene tetrahydromethanopterin reductase-like flavin-dependent oxidoreductase (luciferase family)